MSAPASSQPGMSANLTRQQLDELDELLQRMLDLPVQSTEGETTSTAGPLPSSVSVLDTEPELPPPYIPPLVKRSEPVPSLRSETPVAPPRLVARLPEKEGVSEEESAPILAAWFWPLVWINQGFEAGTRSLGKPARWLRRPSGRTLVGWLGLLLLMGAVALLVWDWVRTNW